MDFPLSGREGRREEEIAAATRQRAAVAESERSVRYSLRCPAGFH